MKTLQGEQAPTICKEVTEQLDAWGGNSADEVPCVYAETCVVTKGYLFGLIGRETISCARSLASIDSSEQLDS